MRLLLDTQLLIWASEPGGQGTPLSRAALALIEASSNRLYFSAVSIWEVTIKSALERSNLSVSAPLLRRGLLDNGYEELPVTGAHAIGVASLPPLHKDPFDRLLIAQAAIEGMLFVTADAQLARYPGAIQRV